MAKDPLDGALNLVAVNLIGHDFIGLGFDIWGDSATGSVFVKSVAARGPARDSGSVEPGDRIKCLSISFDSMTLQDAYDILNCASPYKMRLLLEKQSSSTGAKSNLKSTLTMRQMKINKQQQQTSYLKKLTKRLVSEPEVETTQLGSAQARVERQACEEMFAPAANSCSSMSISKEDELISKQRLKSNNLTDLRVKTSGDLLTTSNNNNCERLNENQHLEQSQSQPEICAGGNNLKLSDFNDNLMMMKKKPTKAAAAANTLTSSVSTPTMNLLTSNTCKR